MSQEKQISLFLNNLLAEDYATADALLNDIMQSKLLEQIKTVDTEISEGLFDRLGARAAGFKAGVGAKLKNVGTAVGSGVKAAGQALTGNLGQAGSTLMKAQGKVNANDPATAGLNAKMQSIIDNAIKDITTVSGNTPAIQPALDALKKAKQIYTPKAAPAKAAPVKAKKPVVAPKVAAVTP